MSAWVLDASVAATWLLPDEHTAAAKRAFARLRAGLVDAHAPDLWLWECGNIIVNSVRRQRVTPDDAVYLWSVLDAVRTRVQLAPFEPAQARACAMLAIDTRLSIYESAYLWLAMSMKLPLLTHDARLGDAARARNVQVISIGDLA